MLRTSSGSRSLRALVVAGCAVLSAWPDVASAAPSPTPSATASCPDPRDELAAMSASRAWSVAGTKGAGTAVSIVGTAAKAAEAECSVRALAPDASVHVFPVDQSSSGAQSVANVQSAVGSGTAVVVFADASVDLTDATLAVPLANAEAQGVVVVAAAGDGAGAMPDRPAEVVNVSAADVATRRLRAGSASGPRVTLAAYGTDTAVAAGYVAATAALLHTMPGHNAWPVRQVAAQLAGTINPVSGWPRDDELGFGVLQPVPALSSDTVDPALLPGFAALFPVLSAPSQSPSPGNSSSLLVGSSGGTQPHGTAPPSQAKSGSGSGSGGANPLLFVGFGALLAAGALVFWQRRRQPAADPLKSPDEWEPPTGPRHSGYSTPPE